MHFRLGRAVWPGLLAAAAASDHAVAGTLTIDFETTPTALLIAANVVVDGTRFSPNCHIDITNGTSPGGYLGSRWLGWDASACGNPPSPYVNPNYLGPDVRPSAVWIDRFGDYFSLASVFLNAPLTEVRSSKGGLFLAENPREGPRVFDFSGEQWTNVNWIMFTHTMGVGLPLGLDQLTLEVPEPGSFVLATSALVALGASRRRRPAA